jgi:hypothetical protein
MGSQQQERQKRKEIEGWRMEMEEVLLIESLSPRPAKKKEGGGKSNVVRRPVVRQVSRHQIKGTTYIWICWLISTIIALH